MTDEGVNFCEFAKRVFEVYESLTGGYNENEKELSEKAKVIIRNNEVILKIDDLKLLIFTY